MREPAIFPASCRGDFGRLGHGTSSDQTIPRAITALAAVPVAKIACGDNHTLVASTTGELYAFGRNQNGQLGLGHNEARDPSGMGFARRDATIALPAQPPLPARRRTRSSRSPSLRCRAAR